MIAYITRIITSDKAPITTNDSIETFNVPKKDTILFLALSEFQYSAILPLKIHYAYTYR